MFLLTSMDLSATSTLPILPVLPKTIRTNMQATNTRKTLSQSTGHQPSTAPWETVLKVLEGIRKKG